MKSDFTSAKDFLGKSVKVKMDRHEVQLFWQNSSRYQLLFFMERMKVRNTQVSEREVKKRHVTPKILNLF